MEFEFMYPPILPSIFLYRSKSLFGLYNCTSNRNCRGRSYPSTMSMYSFNRCVYILCYPQYISHVLLKGRYMEEKKNHSLLLGIYYI